MSSVTVLADRYELGASLGSGGMAQVFQAHDRLLGRDVAVKVFGPAIDPTAPERAQSEMRTLAGLSHPNLVIVHDAGTDSAHVPPRAYLVMQLIDGPSLTDLLKDGPLTDHQVGHLGVGIASALAYVHERGVVHRDIKPGNILLDRESRPFLADFGIAQTLGASALTATGLTVGTAAFLSPEQVRGHDVGPPTDVYAFGLVLLEALTGQREYPGTTVETALARLTRSPVVSGRVPTAWRELLTTMTTSEPEERPSAAEVARALTALLEEPDSGQGPTPTAVLPRDDATVALHRGPTLALAHRGRRHSPQRVVPGAAVAVVALALVVAALTTGSASTGHPVVPAATGTPGAGRLSPDLDRLAQLVKP